MSAALLEVVEVIDRMDTTASVDETPTPAAAPFRYPFEQFDQTPVTGASLFVGRPLRFRRLTTEPVDPVAAASPGAGTTSGPGAADATHGVTHPGVVAARELAGWLNEPLPAVMGAAGLSESTFHWWRGNPTAEVKPGKAGRLLRMHAVLGLLVRQFGVDEVRLWVNDPSRQDLRVDPDRYLDALERDGYRWLRGARRPRVPVDESRWAQAAAQAAEQQPAQLRHDLEVSGQELAPEAPRR